ncbi:MAG TPA: hypothetical protein VJM14_15525 [Burkholderiales bacterium]|nr:hypothetical protein [Burkholderiales bacterium]
MTRPALAILGLVVLGLAAAGAYRELSSAAKVLPTEEVGTPRPLPELRFVDGTGAPRSVADPTDRPKTSDPARSQ